MIMPKLSAEEIFNRMRAAPTEDAYLEQFSGDYYEPMFRRVCAFLVGMLLALLGASFSNFLLSSKTESGQGQLMFNAIFLLVLIGGGIGLMATAVRYRLTLTRNSLTLRRAYFTRTIARADIAGYRLRKHVHGKTLILCSRPDGKSSFSFQYVVQDDGAVMTWLATLPDLDIADILRRVAH